MFSPAMPKEGENERLQVRASKLAREQHELLRDAFRHYLTDELIKYIKANPPDVDLAAIELVLRPGQEIDDWDVVSDCGTCGTCATCGTRRLPEDIPIGVVRVLRIEVRPQLEVRGLKRCMDRVSARLALMALED